MSADWEEQQDELLALRSIFSSEEFVRKESKSAGEVRVSVDLPADFSVALREGETLRQHEISFLPPLLLTFELPQDYPSSSPPSFTLTCSWLTHTQLAALDSQLADLYQATGGAVVLFSWVQFLREDALRFLDIHSLLELPSDEHSTLQDKHNAAPSGPKHNKHTVKSEPTDDQRCNVSDPRKPDISASSSAVQPNSSASDGTSTDSQGVSVLDSCKADQNNYPKTPSLETVVQNQIARASDAVEDEQTFQTSEFKADYENDVSSTEDQSESLPSDQIGLEDFLNVVDVSALSLLPSSSSGSVDPDGQGAASLPVHSRDSTQNKDQPLSGLSLTPSQVLLSQILIYDAAQKQKAFATTVFDCSVCYMPWLGSDCVQLFECGHIFCQTCIGEFCKLQITEGSVRSVTCPQAGCTGTPTPAQVRSLVGEELFSRYDRLLLQSTLDCMPDVTYCPLRSCGSAVILEKSGTAALCSVCGFAFCVKCRKTYHGTDDCWTERKQTKDDTQHAGLGLPQTEEGLKALWEDYTSGSKERMRLLESRYGRNVMVAILETSLSENWVAKNCKPCPHCFGKIEKDGGCNMMTCSRCRQLFCWSCLARLPAKNPSGHFQDSSCAAYQY